MYKYIVFDVDGTLIDTEMVIITSLQRVIEEELNRKEEYNDLLFALGIPSAVTLNKLGINNIAEASNRWKDYMKQKIDKVTVYKDIERLLQKNIDSGLKNGVVTSESRNELERFFTFFHLSRYFDTIVCKEDTTSHKPHPAPLLKFIERAETENSSMLYIGDTIYDMQCAKSAGVDFGLALWGTKTPNSIHSKYRFSSPKQIIELFS